MNRLAKEKRPYEVPHLTVVTFRVERGYAVSDFSYLLNNYLFSSYTSDQETIETRASGGYIGGGNGDTWF